MFGKRWDHPGKKEIALSIKGVTQTLLIVTDPDADGQALAAALTRRLKECVSSAIRESVDELLEYQDNGLDFVSTEEEVLLSASEYAARRKTILQQLHELRVTSTATADAEIDHNPHNGTYGIWLVSGIRHTCLVCGVDSARDALDKAIASGKVGSWEYLTVNYIDPDGQDVIPV